MNYLPLNITSETNKLKTVILGTGTDQGKPYEINPVAKMHKQQGTYPTPEDIQEEIAGAKKTLEALGVKVIQPTNLSAKKQIFTRDIGFVIDNKFVIANMKEPLRQGEIEGIAFVLEQMNPDDVIRIPEGATIEGGDVLVHGEHVFVGISKRTNQEGFDYLKAQFPDKKFHALELVVSDDPAINILHLDCAFQPVGSGFAIFHEEGFVNKPEIIFEVFGEENLILVSQDEKNQMFPNIFSVGPNDVLIERDFSRLIQELEKRGITCHPVKYSETSKLSGLLRCSTLPLIRD
ncbi:arginine deiminase family protein [uncultured Roseivirga sp.]|uniref:dimethylarginine dimethylaminohydrolase family protein n=1 Tax=uncultured Roseivirga sp. TaxID=543088 RepID=UPI000D791549|nr:arginine deiminase family protein [uncultured Roseivirga sp.]PWL32082.1 MAG: amidinotransferase [Roseivirga sp. XM-24bin3]